MAKESISDQLRRLIEASGLSRYAICKQIGIDQSAMSRFMHGKGGLSLEIVDRLCEVLRLEIVAEPPGGETEE